MFAIESYMASCKLRHTRHSFAAMLTALGAEGMIDAVIQNLRKSRRLHALEDASFTRACMGLMSACVRRDAKVYVEEACQPLV